MPAALPAAEQAPTRRRQEGLRIPQTTDHGEGKEEAGSRSPGLRRDRRHELHAPPQDRWGETQGQEVLPSVAEAHAPQREAEVVRGCETRELSKTLPCVSCGAASLGRPRHTQPAAASAATSAGSSVSGTVTIWSAVAARIASGRQPFATIASRHSAGRENTALPGRTTRSMSHGSPDPAERAAWRCGARARPRGLSARSQGSPQVSAEAGRATSPRRQAVSRPRRPK